MFDNDLVLRAIYDNVGNPWAVCISPGPHQYLFASNSNPDSNTRRVVGDHRRDLQDGARRHDLGKFGKAGKALGEFSTVHEIDCRNPERAVRRRRSSAWRAQKIILKPQPPQLGSAR